MEVQLRDEEIRGKRTSVSDIMSSLEVLNIFNGGGVSKAS